ncbi:MAG: extensin family protein [Deltaproteobacteria bacterium]|nr:extensin family protein [Deltaproteobacteria bacterium]
MLPSLLAILLLAAPGPDGPGPALPPAGAPTTTPTPPSTARPVRPPPDPGQPMPAPELPKDLAVAPWAPLEIDRCRDKLLAAGLDGSGFRFSKADWIMSRRQRGVDPIFCHVPQAVVVWKGPTGVSYYGFTFTTCAMALAMTRMERIAQEEARRIFGRPEGENPIRYISHLGTFNCRWLRHKVKQSQHSFGNGLDLAGFNIKGYGDVSVARHWNPLYPAWQKPSEFLQTLARRLRDEQVFTNVLDPMSDEGHWNHIHVDMAPTSDGEPSPALDRAKSMPADLAGDPASLPPVP